MLEVVGRQGDDREIIILDGQHLPPDAGHPDCSKHLPQPPADLPPVCEGQVPQLLPSAAVRLHKSRAPSRRPEKLKLVQ